MAVDRLYFDQYAAFLAEMLKIEKPVLVDRPGQDPSYNPQSNTVYADFHIYEVNPLRFMMIIALEVYFLYQWKNDLDQIRTLENPKKFGEKGYYDIPYTNEAGLFAIFIMAGVFHIDRRYLNYSLFLTEDKVERIFHWAELYPLDRIRRIARHTGFRTTEFVKDYKERYHV